MTSQYDKLIEKHKKLQSKMIAIQQEYTKAARSNTVSLTILQKIADKGFKAEKDAFDASEKIKQFTKKRKV